jgi:CheY-like chemotaxis protein
VRLHLHNRAAGTLETASTGKEDTVTVSLTTSAAGAQAGAVACFHYRTLLVIPDTGRSPFPIVGDAKGKIPRSMMLVPMIAQSEVMGVLELDQDNRSRDFKPEEQAIAQHLANQIGVAIRLLDQRSVQEQLFRTEKMAAVGRLISGVVNELKIPLASIQEIAEKTIAREQAAQTTRELTAIVSELRNAKAMVDRLVAFGSDTPSGVQPVCVPALLRRLIRFREGDSRASGIKINDLTSHEDLTVQGSEGQLEQVFLNLLVHAEQSLTEAPQKSVTVRTSVLAGRLVVEVAFTAILEPAKMEDTASVLALARGIVAGHGGEARLITKTGQDPRFEVELPLAVKERAPAGTSTTATRDSSRPATTLVIEPDDAAQKQLLHFLSARGCRVVPMSNADAALELSHRIRFDAAFCSLHAPGLNWVELSERMQNRVGVFVLLSDGYDPELNADFEGEGRFVLAKPVQETELDRILKKVASHATV